jgi:hypothetical protein
MSDEQWIHMGCNMTVDTIADLKSLIADLPDCMPVRGESGELFLMFVHDFADVDEDRPPPTLLIVD